MNKRDKLEPLSEGWVAFHTDSGERWKHKDFAETPAGSPPAHYRLFVADNGDQRRYVFAPKDPRDSTVWDLREQLQRSEPVAANAGTR